MLKKPFPIVAICLLVAGCSSLKLAYGFAETFVRDRAETYLDISSDEDQAFEEEVAALVSWHRYEMLPLYAAFFESQAQLIETSDPSRADVDEAIARFRSLAQDTGAGAAPFIARVLINHTNADKVEHIEAAMAEKMAERKEQFTESEEDQVDDAVERTVNNLKRFFGALTNKQMAMIREHKSKTHDPSGKWLEWRDKRQQDFLRFLRTQPSVPEIEVYVKVALTAPEEIVGQVYRERSDRWWTEQASLIYDLVTTLNDVQRQNLANNLRGYAVDMVELADAS